MPRPINMITSTPSMGIARAGAAWPNGAVVTLAANAANGETNAAPATATGTNPRNLMKSPPSARRLVVTNVASAVFCLLDQAPTAGRIGDGSIGNETAVPLTRDLWTGRK